MPRYVSRKPKLWVQAIIVKQNKIKRSPLADKIPKIIEKLLKNLNLSREQFTLSTLKAQIIKLSYIDNKGALAALSAHGMTIVNNPEKMPTKLSFDKLPLIVNMPSPDPKKTSLVGDGKISKGKYDHLRFSVS